MGRTVYEYDKNGLARAYEDVQWFLIDKNGQKVSEGYTYIDECGEGYYRAEQGSKKNILRPDGSLVMNVWHNDVFEVNHGLFIYSNTIRKSKTNPKTRYTYGIGHVNGDIIFPMVFDRANWLEKKDGIYVEVGTTPYIVTLDGSVYDPALSHLPKKLSVDYKDIFEKFANWTLPGLLFFYRDTDAPVIVDTTYHVGDILRAGAFIDVTTKLLKPAHKVRYVIASAHAAMMCEVDGLCEANPKVKEWNLCTLHFNSYFKVMDVYEKDGVKQVLLLHIPMAAALFLGHNETAMNFVNEATGDETSLIEMARKSLDEKMSMEVHTRSLDKELVERMNHPIGLDEDFYPVPLAPMEEPQEGPVAALSELVHKISNDGDLEDFIKAEDNFPYQGTKGYICEGCIYANGIRGNGEGCGRLFIKSFRERYMKGHCEYKKTDLFVPSDFEVIDKYRREQAKDTAEKQSDVFALRTVKEFVAEKLGGNIKALKILDLSTLRDDSKYGDSDICKSNIVKAIMTLVFADSWPDLTVDALNHYTYQITRINQFQNLFGSNICDEYFKGMQKFEPSKSQHDRAVKVAHLTYNIGNLVVWPNKAMFSACKEDNKLKEYMDKFLMAMYGVMTEQKKQNMDVKAALYKNRKMMTDYQGREGFDKFIKNMMLEAFVDGQGEPKEVFMFVWSMMKDLDRDTYFKAVDQYCSFCEEFTTKRAERIIEKLESVLERNK